MELNQNFEIFLDSQLAQLRKAVLSRYTQDVSVVQYTNGANTKLKTFHANGLCTTSCSPSATGGAAFDSFNLEEPSTTLLSASKSANHDPRAWTPCISALRHPLFQEPVCPTIQLPCDSDDVFKDAPSPKKCHFDGDPSQTVLERWAALYSGLTENQSDDDSDINDTVELHPVWKGTRDMSWDQLVTHGREPDTPARAASGPNSNDEEILVGSTLRSLSCIQRFMIHPDSKFCRFVAMLSGVIIAQDLVLFPVSFLFEVDSLVWFSSMSWISTLFWSLDMPVSFLSGYYANGVVEMRPSRVACHYMKSFFILDFMILMSDWFTLLMAAMFEKNSLLRVSRTMKYYRFLRIVRMLRLMKIFILLKSYVDGYATELMMVTVRLAFLIFVLLMVSHYMACSWYALAYYNTAEVTWADQHNLAGSSPFHMYTVALHWSLTQLTPATNNIAPVNHSERSFAIMVVLFALIMFSTFLSSLTNALRQIQTLYLHQQEEEAQVRNFLHARGVPLDMARQIWNFYRYHYKTPQKRIHFADLEVMKKLPQQLRKNVHKHINLPVLTRHATFERFSKMDRDAILSICDTCLTEVFYRNESEVFTSGDAAQFMYFLILGSMSYDCKLYTEVAFIQAPQFISEVAVWANWSHCGNLATVSQCEAVLVDTNSFRVDMLRRVRPPALRCLMTYAAGYIKEINSAFAGPHAITDIVNPQWDDEWEHEFSKLVEESFPSDTNGESSVRNSNLRWTAHSSMSALKHAATEVRKSLSNGWSPKASQVGLSQTSSSCGKNSQDTSAFLTQDTRHERNNHG
mmetsp:Transcript_85586/g.163724  ORF Transcript_85586/g.163724 Transcript_85586/m.163724 type:complete len:800 (-) Transcript_85586:93-2492(-)